MDKKETEEKKHKGGAMTEEVGIGVAAEWDSDKDELTIRLNRELLPLVFILITPLMAFVMGPGLRSNFAGVNIYFFVPVIIALFRNDAKNIKIKERAKFGTLFSINIIISVIFFWSQIKGVCGGAAWVFFSAFLVVGYLALTAVSFWTDNPYFVEYFRTQSRGYRALYRALAVFFIFLILLHIPMFMQVVLIMRGVVPE